MRAGYDADRRDLSGSRPSASRSASARADRDREGSPYRPAEHRGIGDRVNIARGSADETSTGLEPGFSGRRGSGSGATRRAG
jgi:hypothetical protein